MSKCINENCKNETKSRYCRKCGYKRMLNKQYKQDLKDLADEWDNLKPLIPSGI